MRLDVSGAGALGDGATDDTDALRAAFAYAARARCSEVYFPAGEYLVDTSPAVPTQSWLARGIVIDAPLTVTLHPSATIRQAPTLATGYRIFDVRAPHVTVRGGTLRGDHGHDGTGTAPFGFGVYGRYVSHLTIEDVTFDRFRGDGIMLYGDESNPGVNADVTIRGVTVTGCKRNGITVGQAQRLLIERSRFVGNGGTLPSSDIDLEGWGGETDTADDVTIRGCRFEDTIVQAVVVSSSITDLRIDANVFRGCKTAVRVSSNCLRAQDVTIAGNSITGPGMAGIVIKAAQGSGLDIVGNRVRDVGRPEFGNYAGGAVLWEAGDLVDVRIERNTFAASHKSITTKPGVAYGITGNIYDATPEPGTAP